MNLFRVVMKKCLICKKQLSIEERDFCETCRTFFEWKYRRSKYMPLQTLKGYFSMDLHRIKFRRTK